MTDFVRLLASLVSSRVDFLIVGGIAAGIHGAARATYDLDIVYSRSTENIGRLVSALAAIHPYPRGAPRGLPFQWDVETVKRGLNFTLTTDIGSIDLFGELTGGGGYDQLIGRSIEVDIQGNTCWVLALPALIEVKRAAGRPRDLDAVAELEALLEESEGE
jgi:hypothetical protein